MGKFSLLFVLNRRQMAIGNTVSIDFCSASIVKNVSVAAYTLCPCISKLCVREWRWLSRGCILLFNNTLSAKFSCAGSMLFTLGFVPWSLFRI